MFPSSAAATFTSSMPTRALAGRRATSSSSSPSSSSSSSSSSLSERRTCSLVGVNNRIRSFVGGHTNSIRSRGRERESGNRNRVVTFSESAPSLGSDSNTAQNESLLNAVWKFTRPHTIRGTILGSFALTSRVLLENADAIRWALLPRALAGVVALLCANAFIVGINQIYDVDIDKVNKPYLPIASGELNASTAWVLILSLGGLGLTIVHTLFGQHIALLYTLSLVIGVVYSVPPLRLKQRPIPAMVCIVLCRGFLLNYGVNDAAAAALGIPFSWSGPVAFITCFVTCFAVIISVAKDLPDVEGDKKNNITTFATQLGTGKVAMASVALLMANYAIAMILGVTHTNMFTTAVMTGGHGVLAIFLAWQASKLHHTNYSQEGIKSFYRFIWNLFYAEYLMYPFL